MFGRDYDHDLAVAVVLWVTSSSERASVAGGEGFCIARKLVDDPVGRTAGVDGDGALFLRETALDVEGVPVAALFELGEAESELPRLTERGAVDFARAAAAHVSDHQLHGAADGGVRAVPLAEDVHLVVHADTVANRTVDDDHRRGEVGGGEDAVHVELFGGDRLDRGDHDREVLWFAPGHDGVDRDLLNCHRSEVRRHHGDHLLGVALCASEHAHHALGRRRDHRQAVRQALVEHELEHVIRLADVDPAGADRAALHLGGEALRYAWLDGL